MELQEWKENIVAKASRMITYKSNFYDSEIQKMQSVLFDFLDEGISVLKRWRKIKTDEEFIGGDYDVGLVQYIIDKNSVSDREMFQGYTIGSATMNMRMSAESKLKSLYPQVM